MSADIEVDVPFRSRSRLRNFHKCVRFRLSCSLGTIRKVLTSDADDECLPDWLSVLSIPCDVESRRAMKTPIKTNRWTEDLAIVWK